MKSKHLLVILLISTSVLFLYACKEKRKPIGQKEVVAKPEELKLTVSEVIASSLEEAEETNGAIAGIDLKEWQTLKNLYDEKDFEPFWTGNGKWLPKGDSLYQFIKASRAYGLFPEDYYGDRLDTLHQKTAMDTSRQNHLDASLWAESDLLLSSALLSIIKDLRIGRLVADSVIQKDTLINIDFYRQQLDSFKQLGSVDFAAQLEPVNKGYHNLKLALQNFLTTADLRQFTKVNTKDTATFSAQLQKRLLEDSITIINPSDSVQLSEALKVWQQKKGLKANGKISSSLFSSLNDNDEDKFVRIAITMDRYKGMPKLPAQYVWVNIPSYRLDVIENDTAVLTSKTVVGKPATRTPQLTSFISDMITYPLWHIPNSIIAKDILPALKKDPGYLARKGFSLVDNKHNEIDPFTVDWKKYEKGIPYTVIQGSGDANALGVIKFNFPNKYAVYLHDTNQREFFSRRERALSHGCVRVQAWQDLSQYLLHKDSLVATAVPLDSMQTWLDRKEKHVISLHNRMPLYIRYFTCEGIDGKLVMHEDIYGEDRRLRQTYFANK